MSNIFVMHCDYKRYLKQFFGVFANFYQCRVDNFTVKPV